MNDNKAMFSKNLIISISSYHTVG